MITIKELLLALARQKASWTENDIKHLGAFEDQPIYIADDEVGIQHVTDIKYIAEFGFILESNTIDDSLYIFKIPAEKMQGAIIIVEPKDYDRKDNGSTPS